MLPEKVWICKEKLICKEFWKCQKRNVSNKNLKSSFSLLYFECLLPALDC